MKEYVAGFLFTGDCRRVTLVQKLKPEWQKGFYNGVGGHVEAGESPEVAMSREFHEEAGLDSLRWTRFALIRGGQFGEEWVVYFFKAFSDMKPFTCTDEKIYTLDVETIRSLPSINNLSWLIPLALDGTTTFASALTA